MAAEGLECRQMMTTLAIAEINYAPHGRVASLAELAVPATDFEFVELMNTGSVPINLAGIRLAQVPVNGTTEGVDFVFANENLGAGQRLVVVRSLAAFRSRYGAIPHVAGEWNSGSLSNQGETLTLLGPSNEVITQVIYDSNIEWPFLADGHGASLEIADLADDPNDPDSWNSSRELGGSPGRAPDAQYVRRVLINEVLSHTDEPQFDSIELLNLTAQPIDIGGWYLTDNLDEPTRYRFPNGARIPANGYLVIDERQFNPGGGMLPTDFGISEYGEDLYLFSPDTNSRPRFLEDMVIIGYTDNGQSVGNASDSRNGRELLRLETLTLGQRNSAQAVSPAIISEIHFHPPDDDVFKEFVEIRNTTGLALDLSQWEIQDGIEYMFPIGATLAANGHALIVAFNPVANTAATAAFRNYYGIGTSVPLFGPWSANSSGIPDRLGDNRETLSLRLPLLENGLVYSALAEFVTYEDRAPWYAVADGEGASLSRVANQRFSNHPESWRPARPSPGAAAANAVNATALVLDQIFSEQIGSDGPHARGSTDVDIYSFISTEALEYQFRAVGTDAAPGAVMLRLFTTDGVELASATADAATRVTELQETLAANTTYLVVVNGTSSTPPADNPLNGTDVFAGQTGSYDLSVTVAEVLSPGLWHNEILPEDTNADGSVTPIDALLVINALNAESSTPGTSFSGTSTDYLDVTNDGQLTPLDALLVINYLNSPPEVAAAIAATAHLSASTAHIKHAVFSDISAATDPMEVGRNGIRGSEHEPVSR